MYKKTKIMTKHTQSRLLGLSIFLILSCSAVNADTSKTATPNVEYKRYKDFPVDPESRKYHRDKDGTYEIKVPYSIQIERVPGAPHLPWMSLYEWKGNAYVLNNEKFYADNGDFLIQLLSQYNYQILRQGSIINLCGTYNFYVGLASYYRGDLRMARLYLQWVVERSEKDDYIQAAKSILKKFPPEQK